MLQRIRESLVLILIALLPFHAFAITVLTKVIEGPGQAPMGEIAIWKEALLGVILIIALVELLAMSYELWGKGRPLKIDVIDILIIALFLLGIVVSAHSSQLVASSFVYGLRYDFIPLIAFVILRRVPWSQWFFERVLKIILIAGGIIAAYGIVSFFLPASFFSWLGYSDLHSLYLPDSPIAPFQQIGGTALRRIQSVMSGPNQLGLWLLIPIAVTIGKIQIVKKQVIQRMSKSQRPIGSWILVIGPSLHLVFCILLLAALLLTFSRAALIGAAAIIAVAAGPVIRSMSRRARLSLVSCLLCFLVGALFLFPSVFLRIASTRGHIENPIKAVQTMVAHPFGLGLGTAGPASNRTSDACVMLEAGSDASWAKSHSNLCVFVNGAQVQPTDRTCNCPFLPENWYLQIGVEMGWIGLFLYVGLVVVVLKRLYRNQESVIRDVALLTPGFLCFLSISIASLFLHAWEDSAVAYTLWILIAGILCLHSVRKSG